MKREDVLKLIVSVLLKGTGMTGVFLLNYIGFLFDGVILKVSNHEIEYKQLSREERELFSVRMSNGLIQTLKLNKIPRYKKVTTDELIQAVLEANPGFKRVMHQLMRWMSSCTKDVALELSAFLVTIMCRSPGQNVAFGYLINRDFVLDNMDSLFEILPGLFYNEEYPLSLQFGERFKTFEIVKRNIQLFKDVFAAKVDSKRPDPKPEAEAETESVDDDAKNSNEFSADSAEFPEFATKSSPAPVEVVKKPTEEVKVVEKPTEEDRIRKIEKLIKSDLSTELKWELMQMLMPKV